MVWHVPERITQHTITTWFLVTMLLEHSYQQGAGRKTANMGQKCHRLCSMDTEGLVENLKQEPKAQEIEGRNMNNLDKDKNRY